MFNSHVCGPLFYPSRTTRSNACRCSFNTQNFCLPLIQPRQRLIGRELEWEMQGEKHMAKQLDCTTSITSTQNYGIQGIHFDPHMTFGRLSHLASKRKPGLINISGVDWTTSQSDHSNRQMWYESSSLNLISGSAMLVGLNMTHISSEHYTTGIFSNVSRSLWHISHFGHTSILNRCTWLTLRVVESTAR